ncbi:MAG: SusC/RagA family TonB-linked outer membrane protein [Candidatus Cryptobacteroides sp.]
MKKLFELSACLLLASYPAFCQENVPESPDGNKPGAGVHTGFRLPASVTDTVKAVPAKGLYMNALDLLQGQSAGVNVTNDGINGSAVLNSIRVRGASTILGENNPMVIIDGVISDITTLSAIYPSDIESFTILKNTSETAAYGSDGSSGVIQVKTRRTSGEGFRIAYEGNLAVSAPYGSLNMLSADEYRSLAAQKGVYINDGGSSTDYYSAITRPAFVQNHYVALGGGSGTFGYRASLGYAQENSVLKDKGNSNIVTKLDVSQTLLEGRIGLDLGVVGSLYRNSGVLDAANLFYSAACQNPTYPAEDCFKNPYAVLIGAPLDQLSSKVDSRDMNIATHLSFRYDILDCLKLNAFGSYYFTSSEVAATDGGSAARSEDKKDDLLGNASLNFGKTWGDHRLTATAKAEYHVEKNSGFYTGVNSITSSLFGYDNLAAAASRRYGKTGSTYFEKKLLSFGIDLGYVLMDRYKVQASARTDGSSLLGKGHQWGFFPSISLSWDLKKEPFLRDVDLVSSLSLEAGYGRSGNTGPINAYVNASYAEPTGILPVFGTSVVVLGVAYNSNPDIEWEIVSSFNVGAELGLWHNRFLLTAEYYLSHTSNMLYAYDVPVPPFTYDKMLANLGSMSNMGVDIGVALAAVKTSDIDLVLSANFAWQRNRLESLSGTWHSTWLEAEKITPIAGVSGAGQVGGDNNVLYQIVGQPVGVFYLPHCKGLVQNPDGTFRYDIEDLDGNGTVDLGSDGDRMVVGQAVPKFTLGSNLSFRWRGLYFTMQINGAFGHHIFNGTSLAYSNMTSFPSYNVLKDAPKKNIADQRVSDYWLEKGDYANIEHLTVGYQIPLRSGPVKSLRISACIKNLAQFTSYSGLTPMINSYVVNSCLGIDDKCCYPLYRTYSLGLSIRF